MTLPYLLAFSAAKGIENLERFDINILFPDQETRGFEGKESIYAPNDEEDSIYSIPEKVKK